MGKIGDARALGALVDALSDKDKDTRQAAARALEQTGTPAIAPLSTALQDGPAVVRTQATGALGRIGLSTGDGRAVEPLFSALDDVDVYVRYSAVEALETVLPMVGAGRVVEVLSVALEDREPLLRQAAVELLGKTNRSAVQPLLVALQDRDPDVRHAAIESLDELGCSLLAVQGEALAKVCSDRCACCGTAHCCA